MSRGPGCPWHRRRSTTCLRSSAGRARGRSTRSGLARQQPARPDHAIQVSPPDAAGSGDEYRLVSMAQRPFLIGVAGGTCSGKTTISEKLAELAGDEHVALIKLD